MARKKKPETGAGSPMTQAEILQAMNDTGLSDSIGKVQVGRDLVFDRHKRKG